MAGKNDSTESFNFSSDKPVCMINFTGLRERVKEFIEKVCIFMICFYFQVDGNYTVFVFYFLFEFRT